MDEVQFTIPASTSNLGPGFDTLGLALDWRLLVRAKRQGAGLVTNLSISGQAAWEGPLRELVAEAVKAWEHKSGKKAEGIILTMESDIPLARGLGSSAAYRLAAAAAVNALSGGALHEPEILELVSRLEAHTDNAVPCMVGGLTVSGWLGDRVHFVRYAVPERYRFVALIPERELATAKAREVLPASVPREHAVFNLQRALWLVNAIAHDRPEGLRGVFEDCLHQPYRRILLPFLPAVISAAEQAGAFGAFLSGAGSTVLAVTDEARAGAVAEAMSKAHEAEGGQARTRVLSPDNDGLQLCA